MTAGQELAKLTGFRLLFNHMVVDLVTEFFEFGTDGFHQLARPFTSQIIEACAQRDVGLIVTHALVLSAPNAHSIIEELSAPYRERGGRVCYVELAAPLESRIERNETANRRAHKKLDWATPERLRELEGWGRWNSDGDFPYPEQHMIIDNAGVPAAEAARRITERFGL